MARSTEEKIALTGLIILLSPIGFFFEPTPVSEIAAVAAIGSIWGIDFGGEAG